MRGLRKLSQLALAALVLGTGCATSAPMGGRSSLRAFSPNAVLSRTPARALPQEAPAQPVDSATLHGDRTSVVALAREQLGKRTIAIGGKRYGDDCTGLVRGVYDQIGLALASEGDRGDNGVTALYRFAQRHGHIYEGGWPVPGDLVFFRDTYDQNHDGLRGDGLTHVGLVDDVEADGTVWVIHRVHRGVVRYRMNLAHRSERHDAHGKIWNDVLRAPGAGGEKLTGQLFAAFANVLPAGPGPAVARR